jgi:hypothetical protein
MLLQGAQARGGPRRVHVLLRAHQPGTAVLRSQELGEWECRYVPRKIPLGVELC